MGDTVKIEPTYDDFIWFVKLGIELGLINKDELKVMVSINGGEYKRFI